MEKFTDFQLSKISHTLGINIEYCINSTQKKDKYLPDEFYRNYYNYGRVSDNFRLPRWIKELSQYIDTWIQSKLYYFQVNKKGIELFRKQFKELVTDTYTPLSKSKQRYQDYLHSECSETFSEYLGIIEPTRKRFLHGYYPHVIENSYTPEMKEKLRRYESQKYDFAGSWETTDKKAKESYKKKLKIHLKYLRDMDLIK
jgi:hypothetical protein